MAVGLVIAPIKFSLDGIGLVDHYCWWLWSLSLVQASEALITAVTMYSGESVLCPDY